MVSPSPSVAVTGAPALTPAGEFSGTSRMAVSVAKAGSWLATLVPSWLMRPSPYDPQPALFRTRTRTSVPSRTDVAAISSPFSQAGVLPPQFCHWVSPGRWNSHSAAVRAAPPVFAGSVHWMSRLAPSRTACTLVGAPGTATAGVPVASADQSPGVRPERTARTRTVYWVPAVRPPMTALLLLRPVDACWRVAANDSPECHCTS